MSDNILAFWINLKYNSSHASIATKNRILLSIEPSKLTHLSNFSYKSCRKRAYSCVAKVFRFALLILLENAFVFQVRRSGYFYLVIRNSNPTFFIYPQPPFYPSFEVSIDQFMKRESSYAIPLPKIYILGFLEIIN